MSASSSEIEREVEASRATLEDTVEALKDKMSMGQMVDEASRYFGDTGGGEILGKLGEQARANPLPLALVGVGLLWLMSGRGQPSLRVRSDYDRDYRDRDYRDRTDYESLGDDEYRRTFGERSVYAGASQGNYSGVSAGMDESWESSEGGGHSAGMVRRRAHDLRDAASGAASGIGGAVSSVAGAVGSAASGVAGVVGGAASVIGSAASGLGSVASTVGRTAYSAAGTVAGGARGGAGAAWRGGSSAYRGASHLGSDAYSGASRMGSSAYYGASSFGRGARRTVADVLDTEPLVLAGLGLAVGAAIGAFLPGTDIEDRYMGETRDRLREDAEAFAREKFEQGKAVAGEAFQTAKEEAEAQGLSAAGGESLVDRVGQVARTTLEKVKESAAEKGLMGSDSDTDDDSDSNSEFSTGSTGSTGGYKPTV